MTETKQERAHAVCSASGSHMWLNCPPSAQLNEQYPDHGSDYAAEGTDAHTLCEYKLRKLIGERAKNPRKKLKYYNAEMESCSDEYIAFITEAVEDIKRLGVPDPLIVAEQRVDFSDYVKDGFGTADCIIIGEPALHIVDYKHGAGVAVDFSDNCQLKIYALGALAHFGNLFDITEVRMSIVQPRRENICTYTITVSELYDWAETTLKPTAALSFEGKGE